MEHTAWQSIAPTRDETSLSRRQLPLGTRAVGQGPQDEPEKSLMVENAADAILGGERCDGGDVIGAIGRVDRTKPWPFV
jgi:hypothetical protein